MQCGADLTRKLGRLAAGKYSGCVARESLGEKSLPVRSSVDLPSRFGRCAPWCARLACYVSALLSRAFFLKIALFWANIVSKSNVQ
jgi:hypothetical protein